MVSAEQAITNRSVRNIRTELEFLSESGVITSQQIAAILAQLPSAGVENASLLSPVATPTHNPMRSPAQTTGTPFNEKQSDYYAPVQPRALPPPTYAASLVTPSIATASALYEYQPSDAGDLAILPSDRISITEFMNADWAKGRNERTGLEGIFPRSYVEVVEQKEKNAISAPPPPARSNYGNLPLDVSQSGGSATPGKESKLNENGKKFGKKMGNAAIFGAGATVGSKIVNGIF